MKNTGNFFAIGLFVSMIQMMAFGFVSCGKPVVGFAEYNFIDTVYAAESSPYHLTINVDWQYPDRYADKNVLHTLQWTVLSDVFGVENVGSSPKMVMEAYVHELATDFKDVYSSYEPGFTSVQQCSFELKAEVISQNNDILAYKIETYSYMGGAHGVGNTVYRNYNLATGKAISEEDLFLPGYKEALTGRMLESLVASDDNVKSIEDLKAMYFVDGIRPNGNFYLTGDGMTYVFNPYEAAAYARGIVEIALSKEELLSLLKSDVVRFWE